MVRLKGNYPQRANYYKNNSLRNAFGALEGNLNLKISEKKHL